MSQPLDLVVRDARLVIPGEGIVEGHLAVKDGVIASIGDGPVADARRVVDAHGMHVMPGVIDPHTHPGLVAPLATRLPLESRGAAAGGVTTLISYIRRPETYRDAVPARRVSAERHLLQDFAFHVTLLNDAHLDEIEMCVNDFGVTSFKVYMNSRMPLSKHMRMDALPGQIQNDVEAVDFDDGFFLRVFRALERNPGTLLNVHCENSDIVIAEMRSVAETGRRGLIAWNDARPAVGEAVAIHTAATLSRAHGVPLYLPHIGNAIALRAVTEARSLGTEIVAETCPHYLILTMDAAEEAKVSPPIRAASDQAAVLDGLLRGELNTIGSDDIPYTHEEKRMATFWDQNTAFSGCGLVLPIAISSGLPLETVATVTSATPAQTFGLAPRKGTLAPGSDADFVIVDIEAERVVRPTELVSSSDFSVYDGVTLRGWPSLTVSRGEVIFEEGRYPAEHGRGRYLSRSTLRATRAG